MRTFTCECGARVFFVNTRCMTCERELAFLPDLGLMAAVESAGENEVHCLGMASPPYRRCENQLEFAVCNWLVPAGDEVSLCASCRLNQIIPDLTEERNRLLWSDIERAKRHLVYTLHQLSLPVKSKAADPNGMAFNVMADTPEQRVLTGHDHGVITLNLREADPVSREKTRIALKEGYRTLLGHLRHEVGHYYWELLIQDSPELLAPCRELFGDERADYAAALKQHYEADADEASWHESFISFYAKAHPWEDWAETWAHYVHMIDTLETARHFGLVADWGNPAHIGPDGFDALIDEWAEVTVALNALNRSMGMPDAYPFAISDAVKEKLRFIAHVVSTTAQQQHLRMTGTA